MSLQNISNFNSSGSSGHQLAHVVQLAGALGLRDAERLRERLIEAIDAHPAVEIHADAVREVDISILQLLFSARRTAEICGRSFTVATPPGSAIQTALVRSGFLAASGESPTPGDLSWLLGGIGE